MRPARRRGVTLLEVLITIFILAIGLLALLVLFPLGALEMGRALKDDRCASSAALADAIAQAQNIRTDTFVTSDATVLNSFTNPFSMMVPSTTGMTLPATPNTPSYGVYVDPWGYLVDGPGTATGEFLGQWPPPPTAGPLTTPGIRRRSITLMNWSARPGSPSSLTTAECYRWCTLLDDIYFKNDGTPDLTTGGIQRGCRYTWAWLVRQATAGVPSPAQVYIIVYQDRDTTTSPGDKTTYPVVPGTGVSGSNTVTLDYSTLGTPPPMKVGRWILDTTQWNVSPYGDPVTKNGPVPGYFYRVVNYSDDSTTMHMQLDLETHLQNPAGLSAQAIVVMENVAEVIYKGQVFSVP
jgi:prepilin-type N-terminal cleavage/methylation domain-containing protein